MPDLGGMKMHDLRDKKKFIVILNTVNRLNAMLFWCSDFK